MTALIALCSVEPHVPEMAFGKWFLQTSIWTIHMLERALNDLECLIPARQNSYPVVADVDCGWGRSLNKLNERFQPQRLIAMDLDPTLLAAAAEKSDNLVATKPYA